MQNLILIIKSNLNSCPNVHVDQIVQVNNSNNESPQKSNTANKNTLKIILKINNPNTKEKYASTTECKKQTQTRTQRKNKARRTPEGTHAPQKPREPHEPHETAFPETKTQGFTTCQFTLNTNLLTHKLISKNISLLFFKSHAHAQCISTLVNNSKISHYSQ